MKPSAHEITGLLQAWSEGEQSALKRLVSLVYQELYRLAHRYMAREWSGHSLQTSALLNEAYLRLVDSPKPSWRNHAHFFSWLRRELRKEKAVGA